MDFFSIMAGSRLYEFHDHRYRDEGSDGGRQVDDSDQEQQTSDLISKKPEDRGYVVSQGQEILNLGLAERGFDHSGHPAGSDQRMERGDGSGDGGCRYCQRVGKQKQGTEGGE